MLERITIHKRLMAFAAGVATAIILATPLTGRTLEPNTMFVLGFGLIGLRVFFSYFFKMKPLPAKTP
jgi:hypothetical protein